MRVRLLKDCDGERGPLPKGYEIDQPDSYRLMEVGVAEPVDDEAIEKWKNIQAESKRLAILKITRFDREMLEKQEQDAAEQRALEKARQQDFEERLKGGESVRVFDAGTVNPEAETTH